MQKKSSREAIKEEEQTSRLVPCALKDKAAMWEKKATLPEWHHVKKYRTVMMKKGKESCTVS